MACNRLPDAYPSLIVLLTTAHNGAEELGEELPLLVNTAPLIAEDRLALITAQAEHRAARRALVPLREARRLAVKAAYDFALTARDVIQFYLGREWSGNWEGTGWEYSLSIPQGFADLFALTQALRSYFAAESAQENPLLNVTSAQAQALNEALRLTNEAVNHAEAVVITKRQVRDKKLKAARKRLCGLNKELSMRLEPMDPRWLRFGFNKPGAPATPAVPEDVVVTPLANACLQIECEASPNATGYRFYVQRPEIDPEPVVAGGSAAPLFVTEPLVPGTEYLVYVSAVNEGAESNLSTAVSARTSVVMAAA